jgi:branched-chain amino acid transport system ATP-binding protein
MGLAPNLVDQIFDTISDLHGLGTTILLVEQNAKKAIELADRGVVLRAGAVAVAGSAAELMTSEEVRAAYLGA